MNAFIRLVYSVLIAVSVVAFVGVGVNTLYEAPKYEPNYSTSNFDDEDFEGGYTNYLDEQKEYYRNISYIILPLSLALVAGGVLLLRKVDVISEGLALGGVATAVYGVITASLGDQRALRFVAVTFMLTGVLMLALFRFNPQLLPNKKR